MWHGQVGAAICAPRRWQCGWDLAGRGILVPFETCSGNWVALVRGVMGGFEKDGICRWS